MSDQVFVESRDEMEELLQAESIGYLGLSMNGKPYVVPLNYSYSKGTIIFHCALEGKKLDLQAKQMQFVQKLEEEKKMNDAKIVELHARAAKEIEEAGAAHAGIQLAAFEATMGAMKDHSDSLDRQRKTTLEEMKHESEQRNMQAGGGQGMASASGDQGNA